MIPVTTTSPSRGGSRHLGRRYQHPPLALGAGPYTPVRRTIRLHAHPRDDAVSVGDELLRIEFKLQQLQLRLQRATAQEDYETASLLKEQISHTQLQLRKIQIDREHEIIRYDIGDVIEHKRYGYRGIIMGYTPECQASAAWRVSMNVEALERGTAQPFYHVLVDSRDRPGGQTTYVAEENIMIRPWCEIVHPLVQRYFVISSAKEEEDEEEEEEEEEGQDMGMTPSYKPSAELRGIFLKDL